ncbi:MAG: hypothetical protein J5517_04835 [Eubacterium sp.]|nr:hypothetical protein [Eubacterium sp.]
MKRVNEKIKNQKRIRCRIIAMITAGLICLAAFPSFPGKAVYAEEASTEAAAEIEGEEKTDESNILAPDTGRVEFWEWKRFDGNNVRSIFGDNKYHPVMFCMYKFYSKKNNKYLSFIGNSIDELPGATTDAASAKKFYITPGEGKTKYQFLSSYADKSHYFLPTKTDRVNDYKSDFNSTSVNVESTTCPEGFGSCLSTSIGTEEHSAAYFINCEESLLIKSDNRGVKNAISEEDFNSLRFFTKGDSMGVPWVMVKQWGDSTARQAIKMCFPKKQMTTEEAMVYQPDSSEFYLYSAAYHTTGDGPEPTLYARKGNYKNGDPMSDKDWFHLILYGNMAYIMAYNDDYRNDVSDEDFYANVFTGETDSAFFAVLGNQTYPYVAIGTKSAYFMNSDGRPFGPMQRYNSYCVYRPFVGTPHLFTSITTRTIPAGKLYPISNEAFMKPSDDGKDKAAQSEGIIIPKGETLTIEGTVTVSCKLINNGKIVIKDGGTLLIKKGGTIFPYTKICDGQGTIDCQGGNVVIMEGGSIYGFCNGSTKPDNPYDQTNAPLSLTGGGTLINYGNLVLTYGIVDKGSKIENRAKGKIILGYNRKDPLDLNPNTSSYLSKSSPNNYSKDSDGRVTIGLFGIRESEVSVYFDHERGKQYISNTVDYNGTLVNEKTATITGKDLVYIDITTPEY